MSKVCVICGSSKDMVKVLDKKYGIKSERHRVCFKCQPSMDANDYGHCSKADRPFKNQSAYDGAMLPDLMGIDDEIELDNNEKKAG